MDMVAAQNRLSALRAELTILRKEAGPLRQVRAIHAQAYQTQTAMRHACETTGGEWTRAFEKANALAEAAHIQLQAKEEELDAMEEGMQVLERQILAWERFLEHVEPQHIEDVRNAKDQVWEWPGDKS